MADALMPHMTGTTLSHYLILEELGHGGMGVVYRARDEHLPRDVALKVLPAGLFSDETARSRFRREAQTLSQLNHPNVAMVFEFGRENGVDFLAMEFVEGETLAAKVAEGPLPEKDVIALGTQITEALEEAHEHGIIHRDLKPGNVMVTPKGRAKVLDFGLAKLLKPTQADAATASLAESQTGAVMGTLPYMSPEQLQGKPADARTDIYGLGTILYELATGKRPFPEKQSTPLIASILAELPQPPRELNGQVSRGLEAIIFKALQKNPEQRYQSSKELREDLGRLSIPGSVVGAPRRTPKHRWALAAVAAAILVVTLAGLFALNIGGLRDRTMTFIGARHGVPLPKIESIAVLPLANLSGDPEQEYFADGMTEELITNLGNISALRVTSRTSVMRYKKTEKTIPQIARELKVDAVVEGSVARSGDRVRIAAQLIHGGDERQLWADTYESDLRDVLVLQSEIARGIAGGIRATLTTQEQARLNVTRRVDPDAQAAYLRGRYFINRWPSGEFVKCAEYLEEATRRDPSYAEAHGALAFCYSQLSWYRPPKEIFPRVKAAALKSLQIDNNLAEGHYALGTAFMFFDWNWEGADRELKKAIDLSPNSALAHLLYSTRLLFPGHFDEAITEARKALELDPASLLTNRGLTFTFLMARRGDDALEQANATLELDPTNVMSKVDVGSAYLLKGQKAEAQAEAKRYGLGDFPLFATPSTRNRTLERLSRDREASSQQYVDAFFLAIVYAYYGDRNRAIKWLEKAYEERSSGMIYIKVNPTLDQVRSDPRFQDLVRRMNFPP